MNLYPHQIEALKQSENQNHVAFYYDMGLGKTYIGSEKMNEIGNRMNLVICQKSKVNDWFIHFSTNYPEWLIVDYTKAKNQKLTAEDLVLYSGCSVVVVIVNYELAWRRTELSRLSEFTLMLDESSLIQNYMAKQTKFIVKKLHFNSVILLSGTPCGGKFENLWTQSKLLGCELTKKQFEDEYVNFETIRGVGGRLIRIPDRKNPYKNVDELKSMLKLNHAYFKKTEEVIDLPEQRFIKIYSPVTSNYRRFKKDRIVSVSDKEFLGNSVFNYRLGLRMLASGYSENKLESVKDLIESTSDRLIIFYNFNQEFEKLKNIAEVCNKSVSVVNGKEKDLTAYESENDSVTLCQYQAGSMGLNLQLANKIIYFSLPERCELFEQSKKRIHRIGQNNICTYYLMITPLSIDESILRALEKREDYTDELFRKEFE